MANFVDMPTVKTLGEFILDEMHRRKLSARKFAELVDVSHETINKFLNHGEKEVGEPSIAFLQKLSKATGVDICTLIGLVVPDADLGAGPTAEDRLLLDRIRKLPEPAQDLVESFIINGVFKQGKK